MAETTVTVGDTEVEIRETDGGFEAVEVEDVGPEIPHVRFRARDHSYGAVLPITADFSVERLGPSSDYNYEVHWFEDDDASDMGDWPPGDEYDRGANVHVVELMEM